MGTEIIIKNAKIYDYHNKINGEIKDILISNGKIVDKLKDEKSAVVVDGSGHIVFPGAIDIKSHFFSAETNYVRVKALNEPDLGEIPTYDELQKLYLNHGFTFLCETDVPMTQAKITLYNMKNSPLLDHALIMDFGSNWTFFNDIQNRNHEKNIAVIMSKMLGDIKGYGISINSPYHQEFWHLNKDIPENPQKIPMFNFSPYDAISDFLKANELARFRAPMFLSPYDIENPTQEANHISLIEKLIGESIKKGSEHRTSILHLSNANRYFTENSDLLIDLYKKNPEFEMDVSPLIMGGIKPLISRDRNLVKRESKISGIPVMTVDLEFDTEYYITSRILDRKNSETLKLWNSALEIILKLKQMGDLSRISLTTNSPFNMSINDLPIVYSWLLNSEARHSYHKNLNISSSEKLGSELLDISLDLYDLSGLISANPAKSLGLIDKKGQLGVNADADIVLYKIDPEKIKAGGSAAKDEIINGFSNASTIIKNGVIIKQNNKLLSLSEISSNSDDTTPGKILWTKGTPDATDSQRIIESKLSFYDKHFSLYYNTLINEADSNMEQIE